MLPLQLSKLFRRQIEPSATAPDGQVVLHIIGYGIARQAEAVAQVDDLFRRGVVAATQGRARIGSKELRRPVDAMHVRHQNTMHAGMDHAIAVVGAVVHAHAADDSETKAKTRRAHEMVQMDHKGLWLERAA